MGHGRELRVHREPVYSHCRPADCTLELAANLPLALVQVKAYANVCGLLALPDANAGTLEFYGEALRRAAADHAPVYT